MQKCVITLTLRKPSHTHLSFRGATKVTKLSSCGAREIPEPATVHGIQTLAPSCSFSFEVDLHSAPPSRFSVSVTLWRSGQQARHVSSETFRLPSHCSMPVAIWLSSQTRSLEQWQYCACSIQPTMCYFCVHAQYAKTDGQTVTWTDELHKCGVRSRSSSNTYHERAC